MNSPLISLLVLAGIAVFLILRLRNVLGTREGFEKPPLPPETAKKSRPDFEVIEGGPDRDIIDHVDEDSDQARELAAMKRIEPSFSVTEFVWVSVTFQNQNVGERPTKWVEKRVS